MSQTPWPFCGRGLRWPPLDNSLPSPLWQTGGCDVQCPQCQTENKAGRKFCAACGQTLALTCPQGAFVNEPDDRFCGGCGQALSPAVPTPAPLQERAPVVYTPKHWPPKFSPPGAGMLSRPGRRQGNGHLAGRPVSV